MGRGPEKDRTEARIKLWGWGSHIQETHDLRPSGQGSVYKCPFSLLLPRVVHTHSVMGSDKIKELEVQPGEQLPGNTWEETRLPRPPRDRHYPGPC